MNDMHLVDDLSVYTFQTLQKKQIWLSCILFYNLSEVIIQITSKGLKCITKFDGTCEGNSLLIREPWFWNGAGQSLDYFWLQGFHRSSRKISIGAINGKIFHVGAVTAYAGLMLQQSSILSLFFFFPFCCFYFLKMKWDICGEEWRGCVWIFFYTASFRRTAKSYSEVE